MNKITIEMDGVNTGACIFDNTFSLQLQGRIEPFLYSQYIEKINSFYDPYRKLVKSLLSSTSMLMIPCCLFCTIPPYIYKAKKSERLRGEALIATRSYMNSTINPQTMPKGVQFIIKENAIKGRKGSLFYVPCIEIQMTELPNYATVASAPFSTAPLIKFDNEY